MNLLLALGWLALAAGGGGLAVFPGPVGDLGPLAGVLAANLLVVGLGGLAAWGRGAWVGLPLGVVAHLLGRGWAWAAEALGLASTQAGFLFLEDGGWPAVVGWAFVLLGAPVTEELVWRGVVYARVEQAWGARAAVVASGLGFGVLHAADPWVVPLMLILGLGLGLLRRRQGGVGAGILAHVAFNAGSLAG